MAKKKKPKVSKSRNWLAIHAHLRSGGGNHGDAKKQRSRTRCRGKVQSDA